MQHIRAQDQRRFRYVHGYMCIDMDMDVENLFVEMWDNAPTATSQSIGCRMQARGKKAN